MYAILKWSEENLRLLMRPWFVKMALDNDNDISRQYLSINVSVIGGHARSPARL